MNEQQQRGVKRLIKCAEILSQNMYLPPEWRKGMADAAMLVMMGAMDIAMRDEFDESVEKFDEVVDEIRRGTVEGITPKYASYILEDLQRWREFIVMVERDRREQGRDPLTQGSRVVWARRAEEGKNHPLHSKRHPRKP